MGRLFPTANDIFRGIRQFSARHNDFTKQSVLSNGITLTTQPRLLDSNLSFTIHINSGSFEDPDGKEGVAHFLEHILMDYAQWNQEFQRRKGHFGLWTSAENIKMAGELPNTQENRSVMVAAISDFLHGRGINEEPFIREKRRILNEIGIYNDDAMRKSHQKIGQAFARTRADSNIGGTREGVRNTTLDDVKAYHQKWFKGPNIYIGITGKMSHDLMVNIFDKSLSDIPADNVPELIQTSMMPGDYRFSADLDQLYFRACFPLPATGEKAAIIHHMASNYVGEKISSEIVFKSGIVYAAYADGYVSPTRAGHFDLCANIMPEDAEFIIPELTGVITSAITHYDESAFSVIKDNFRYEIEKNRTIYPLHTSNDIAIFPISLGRIVPTAEREAMIEDVQPEDVHRYLVDTVFANDPAIVTLGDDRNLGSYDDFVEPIRAALAKQNVPCPK